MRNGVEPQELREVAAERVQPPLLGPIAKLDARLPEVRAEQAPGRQESPARCAVVIAVRRLPAVHVRDAVPQIQCQRTPLGAVQQLVEAIAEPFIPCSATAIVITGPITVSRIATYSFALMVTAHHRM
jgi:hypothetical protein